LRGGDPSGGDIVHTTEATAPEDRTRTEIGIGEPVDLQLCSYYDMDIWVDDLNNEEEREDSVGVIEWYLEGPGRLDSNQGASNYYYAPLCSADTSACVQVALHDSGNQFVDSVINHQVCFNIRVPSGVTAEPYFDDPIGTAGPPDSSIGARSYFFFQTLPNTVNFGYVCFRENIAEQTFNWPKTNTTQYVRPAATVGFSVEDMGTSPNWYGDMVNTGGPWDLERLYVADPTPHYADCQFDVVVALQFLRRCQRITFRI
jgi:hypothetical protein